MKILIVTYAFVPISSPGAKRMESFAKYLSKSKDIEVTVLTCSNAYSSMNNVEESVNSVDYNIVKSLDSINKNALSNGKNEGEKSFKRIKTLVKYVANKFIFPDRDITWYRSAVSALSKEELQSFDFVIGTYPYVTNLLVAKKLAKISGAKLILDYRDLWTEDENNNGLIKGKLNKLLENNIISAADGIVSVSDYNVSILKNKVNEFTPTALVYNGYDDEKITDVLKTKQKKDINRFTVTYAGSFYKGERDPYSFLKSISNLKNAGLLNKENFIFNVIGNIEEFLVEMVNTLGIDDLVNFKGLLSQEKVFKELLDSDIQLIITRTQAISKGEMTTKVFEYIGIGNPILCLSKPDFEISKVLGQVNFATTIDVDRADTIQEYLNNSINGTLTKTENTYRQRFSRKGAAKDLECFLKEF
ncbi:hypothetical protein AB4380_09865 [Vibrio breoganii]